MTIFTLFVFLILIPFLFLLTFGKVHFKNVNQMKRNQGRQFCFCAPAIPMRVGCGVKAEFQMSRSRGITPSLPNAFLSESLLPHHGGFWVCFCDMWGLFLPNTALEMTDECLTLWGVGQGEMGGVQFGQDLVLCHCWEGRDFWWEEIGSSGACLFSSCPFPPWHHLLLNKISLKPYATSVR